MMTLCNKSFRPCLHYHLCRQNQSLTLGFFCFVFFISSVSASPCWFSPRNEGPGPYVLIALIAASTQLNPELQTLNLSLGYHALKIAAPDSKGRADNRKAMALLLLKDA
ncbi:hypothetical protein KIL84_014051 [Mauremys mutica]|uniref:Uncharacterized protein n=1 Tax=Mauremys mutica TaxID=74926 RepID=A0A9D3WX59_9SAUR|nr:hypothetical protein KIL84_014051 [Mauremys mutica]